MTERLLTEIALEVIGACKADGLRAVEVKLAPVVFYPELICLLHQSLRAAGFEGDTPDVTHHVFLDKNRPDNRFSKTAQQKLCAGQREGYRFSRCVNAEEISRALGVITTNRRVRGYSPSLDANDLRILSDAIGVAVFVLDLGGTPAAAAVCLPNGVASFHIAAWGHDPTLKARHPMNVLAFEVLRELSSLGVKRVDLGSSSQKGVVSTGLCSFKRSLGAEGSTSFRLRFHSQV